MFAARKFQWLRGQGRAGAVQHAAFSANFFLYLHKTHRLNPLPLNFLQSQTLTKTYFLLVKISDPPPGTSDLEITLRGSDHSR